MSKEISRRNFLKMATIGFGAMVYPGTCRYLSGISPNRSVEELSQTGTNILSETPAPSQTSAATDTLIPTHKPTETLTSTPEATLTYRQNHERERLRRLESQGPAQTIPALEYHGDNYYFDFNGTVVELDPEGFNRQMEWFAAYDFHAVTSAEIAEFVNGQLDLPARSVVLTFDMGHRSVNAIYRILSVFEQTDMHGIFMIYTIYMETSESVVCRNDVCWEAFRDAYRSNVVSIGSHTATHRDFSRLSAEEGLADLALSKGQIEDRIGITIDTLAWPFEASPSWAPQIAEIGYRTAFGGNTYPILRNAINFGELNWYNLPRVLPPNSNGISGRPNNKTLAQMMELYTTPGLDGVVFCD